MKTQNNILEILQSLGYIFPITEEGVEIFESNFNKEIEKEKPINWDNPLEILKKGKVTDSKRKNDIDITFSEDMAQAARFGKKISENIKNKMLEDRNNAEE